MIRRLISCIVHIPSPLKDGNTIPGRRKTVFCGRSNVKPLHPQTISIRLSIRLLWRNSKAFSIIHTREESFPKRIPLRGLSGMTGKPQKCSYWQRNVNLPGLISTLPGIIRPQRMKGLSGLTGLRTKRENTKEADSGIDMRCRRSELCSP